MNLDIVERSERMMPRKTTLSGQPSQWGYTLNLLNPHDICQGKGHNFIEDGEVSRCEFCEMGHFSWCFRRLRRPYPGEYPSMTTLTPPQEKLLLNFSPDMGIYRNIHISESQHRSGSRQYPLSLFLRLYKMGHIERLCAEKNLWWQITDQGKSNVWYFRRRAG